MRTSKTSSSIFSPVRKTLEPIQKSPYLFLFLLNRHINSPIKLKKMVLKHENIKKEKLNKDMASQILKDIRAVLNEINLIYGYKLRISSKSFKIYKYFIDMNIVDVNSPYIVDVNPSNEGRSLTFLKQLLDDVESRLKSVFRKKGYKTVNRSGIYIPTFRIFSYKYLPNGKSENVNHILRKTYYTQHKISKKMLMKKILFRGKEYKLKTIILDNPMQFGFKKDGEKYIILPKSDPIVKKFLKEYRYLYS
jgi:hypothetical protein